MAIATLTPREVAELAGIPKRVVDRAVQEHVLVARRPLEGAGRRAAQQLLPSHAVAYAAVVAKLDLKLTKAHKKRLLEKLARLQPAEIRTARIEITPAVEIDIGRLVGDAMDRAEHYRTTRDKFIVKDEAVKGGTPIVRGTRMTVYSVLGRIEHGDTVDDVLADNPDLQREAIDAAITYARTHPLIERRGGKPWSDAA
jgi:uncharacterized protein (DUF433 family)